MYELIYIKNNGETELLGTYSSIENYVRTDKYIYEEDIEELVDLIAFQIYECGRYTCVDDSVGKVYLQPKKINYLNILFCLTASNILFCLTADKAEFLKSIY